MIISVKVKWIDGDLTNAIISPEYITFDGFYLEIHFHGENISCLRIQCSESLYRLISNSLLSNGSYHFISEVAYETLYSDSED